MYFLRKLVTVVSAFFSGTYVRVFAVTTSPPQSKPALVATSPAAARHSFGKSASGLGGGREFANHRRGSRRSTSCRSTKSRRGSDQGRRRAGSWCDSRSPDRWQQ